MSFKPHLEMTGTRREAGFKFKPAFNFSIPDERGLEMKRKTVFIFVIILVLNLMIAAAIFAVGVQPLLIELTAKPGDTIPFQMQVVPGAKPEKISLKLYKAIQQDNGDYTYKIPEPGFFPDLAWFTIPAEIVTSPGKPSLVKGLVKVPLNAGGTYTVAVMVESPEPEKKTGMIFTVRYAIRIHLRVERPGLRSNAEVTMFDMVRSKTGEPMLRVQARNTSRLDYATSAMITIRDSRKKLRERVELRPELGWSYNFSEWRLLPDSELMYTGLPKEALLPGQYELRLFYRYGTSGQILLTKQVNIKEGDYTYPASKIKFLKINPTELDFTGKPGTSRLKAVKYENRFNKPVVVTVETTDVEADYPYSIRNNTRLEIKGETKFILEPGRIATNILAVKFPQNAKIQGNYGFLRVKVYTADENKVLLEESSVILAAAVSGKYRNQAEATDVSGDWDGEKFLVSAVIKNSGNIRITPEAKVLIRDSDGKVLEVVDLGTEGDLKASALPNKLVILTGFAEHVTTGKYTVQITISNGEQNIGSSVLGLVVKQKKR